MARTLRVRGPGVARFGPVGGWTPALGEAFLALLRETGNARASARALGHSHLFDNRMRRHPDFRRACAEAIAGADARLGPQRGRLLPPVETKAMPPRGTPPPRPREQIIRRTSNGRTQIAEVRDGDWTSEKEAAVLARLRATGNFGASARAAGVSPSAVFRRIAAWPAFGREVEAALDEAGIQLDYKLIAHAHNLLRAPGEAAEAGIEEEELPFDPEAAMRIIGFLDRRKGGRTTRGPRNAPSERSFDDAVASILAKVRAIARHRELEAERAVQASPPLDGEG